MAGGTGHFPRGLNLRWIAVPTPHRGSSQVALSSPDATPEPVPAPPGPALLASGPPTKTPGSLQSRARFSSDDLASASGGGGRLFRSLEALFALEEAVAGGQQP